MKVPLVCLCTLLLGVFRIFAQPETACSSVTFSFEKELTFEREAFRAWLTVRNESPSDLEAIAFTIEGLTENGERALFTSDASFEGEADFFIDATTLPSGTIPSGDARTYEMLFIPTVYAGNEDPYGSGYSIGGTFSYALDGLEGRHSFRVPDAEIFVRSLPILTLDQFLPLQVLGDDALTPGFVEPIIPFSFLMILKNNGFGEVDGMSLVTSQPTIVENDLGFPAAVELIDVRLNGISSGTRSLNLENLSLGSVDSGRDRLVIDFKARSKFSGQFTEMETAVFHAEGVGGTATALLRQSAVRDHFLIGQVQMSGDGRDQLFEILGRERLSSEGLAGPLLLHESDRDAQAVEDRSDSYRNVNLNLENDRFSVPFDGHELPVYFSIKNAGFRGKTVVSAELPGSVMVPDGNCWIDQLWNKDALAWEYYLHVFSQGPVGDGLLSVVLADASNAPGKPTFDPIPDQSVEAGGVLSLVVRAVGTNEAPGLADYRLAPGMRIEKVDAVENATRWRLRWEPDLTDAGLWPVELVAVENGVEGGTEFLVSVGIDPLSAYLLNHFGSVDVDLLLDSDRDQLNVFEEFVLSLDPLRDDAAERIGFFVREVDGREHFAMWVLHRDDIGGFDLQVNSVDSVETLSNPVPAVEVPSTMGVAPQGMRYREFIVPEPMEETYQQDFLVLEIEPVL